MNKDNIYHIVYTCNSEFYKISLNVVIDYNTFDIIYQVINNSSTTFCGEIQLSSSMLGNNKICKKLFNPNDVVEFKGNLTDSIVYNGEFIEDISIAYLNMNNYNYVISNKVIIQPLEPEPIKANNWIYSIKFIYNINLKTVCIFNSLTSNTKAKNIVIELVYFSAIQKQNITISSFNEYPNEITLEEDKFIFNIPSLMPGEFRNYNFNIINAEVFDNNTIFRIKSDTPFLFQPNQDIIYAV